MTARSISRARAAQFHAHQPEKMNAYSYIGEGIAVPHLRIDNLAAPELILGLSPEGISFQRAQSTYRPVARHSGRAARRNTCSSCNGRFAAPRDPRGTAGAARCRRVVKIIARAEQQSALPTYINLTQEQIGFELQTDLMNGLTLGGSASRLGRYGPTFCKRARRDPWYFKLLRNFSASLPSCSGWRRCYVSFPAWIFPSSASRS